MRARPSHELPREFTQLRMAIKSEAASNAVKVLLQETMRLINLSLVKPN